MKHMFAVLAMLFLMTNCNRQISSSADEALPSSEGELIFQSGFEDDCRVVPRNGGDSDIVGADNTLSEKNDWVEDLDNHPNIGNFNLQYQGGDTTMRFAKIIPEPGNPQNHVLWFWLDKPNVGNSSKGRIQGNLYGNNGLKEVYQSVRVFLTDDFQTVRTYPKEIHWLTIAEFWNNITWSQQVPYRFRVTLGIGKPVAEESDLYFILDAQDCELFEDGRQKYTTIWSETNRKVKVPIGQWFTMDYYFKEGDAENGRFYLSIQPDDGEKQVIFDVINVTHNTQDPAPDGLGHFNPIKMYTSKDLIHFMHSQGRTLQIYWDDLKLWKDKRP